MRTGTTSTSIARSSGVTRRCTGPRLRNHHDSIAVGGAAASKRPYLMPPVDSPPLGYAPRIASNSRAVVGVVLPFAALAVSIAVAIFSFSRMDGERLLWEGGYQYFMERFPFAIVLGLAAVGAIAGAVCAIVVRSRRGIALCAIACNVLWAAWWARHLLR